MDTSNHGRLRVSPRVRADLLAVLLITLCTVSIVFPDGELLHRALASDSDYASGLAAIMLFVQDSWHYPLGANPHFGDTNIAITDSVPLLALVLKSLHPLVDLGGRAFDAWILISYALTATFAVRIARTLSDTPITVYTLAVLLNFNLIHIARLIGAQHVALASNWLLLWAIAWCLKPANRVEAVLCVVAATLVHPYLAMMSLVLLVSAAIAGRQWVLAAVLPLSVLGAMLVVGHFDAPLASVSGAKQFAIDLLLFFNSFNWGLIPMWYEVRPPRLDSLVFLGTGTVFLLATGFARAAANKIRPPEQTSSQAPFSLGNRALWFACLGLAGYATVFKLQVMDVVLLSIEPPQPFQYLYGHFRAAGRFAIPLCYLLVIVSVAGTWRSFRPKVATALLVCACALQVADVINARRHALHLHPQVQQDVEKTRQLVASLELDGWNGRVLQPVRSPDLEHLRLLDLLLVERGARYFSAAHDSRAVYRQTDSEWAPSRDENGSLYVLYATDAGTVPCVLFRQFCLTRDYPQQETESSH